MRSSHNHIIRPIIGALLTFISIQNVLSATYYVAASNGNDSRSVSVAQNAATPWKTIQKAANQAVAGDTVKVAAGTYNGAVLITGKNGSLANPIKFQPTNWSAARPIVIGASGDEGAFVLNNSTYVEISGFETSAPGLYGKAIAITNYSHHVKIDWCIARNSGESGIGSLYSDYITINNCDIYNNCGIGIYQGSGISLWKNWWSDSSPGYHNILTNNRIRYNRATFSGVSGQGDASHTDGNGIIIDTSLNFNDVTIPTNPTSWPQWSPKTLIQYNTVEYNGGRGIHVFQADSVDVYNNTIAYNLQDDSPLIRGATGGEGTAIRAHHVDFYGNTIRRRYGAAFVLGGYGSLASFICYEWGNTVYNQ